MLPFVKANQMSFELQREQLVENELRILGIRDEAVLAYRPRCWSNSELAAVW